MATRISSGSMDTATVNLAKVINDYGILKAAQAELDRREKELKDLLVGFDAGAYESELFRLTISETIRETLDMKAVREKLTPQFIRAHTNRTPVRTYRVVARNGRDVA